MISSTNSESNNNNTNNASTISNNNNNNNIGASNLSINTNVGGASGLSLISSTNTPTNTNNTSTANNNINNPTNNSNTTTNNNNNNINNNNNNNNNNNTNNNNNGTNNGVNNIGSGNILLGNPGTTSAVAAAVAAAAAAEDETKIYGWIHELTYGASREKALLELGKKREQFDDLAVILWHSFGVMTVLISEIVAVYPYLSPPILNAAASNRVCNALALLQCVASHSHTRSQFLNAHLPLFLYPFLNTTSKTRPFEYLRLTSLGVIGALVKNDSPDVINFLLSTEIIPLCLRIMETGSELSKTVAIFIVQKILLDDMGLSYICQTYERFYAVGSVLASMVSQLVESQTARLLKHVVRCYLRLSDNSRAREALRQCLPEPLRNATFSNALKDDAATKRCLSQLLVNLSDYD